MTEKLITIKEVSLNNNCPECYSKKGLKLSFSQKFKENNFYKSITSEITHDIECTICKTIIYPVQWTDDIDRVFEYQLKALNPKKTSTYLKKISWVIIFITLAMMIGVFIAVLWPRL